MYQPCSSAPPTPSGSLSPRRGPAPYPSSEIAKLWTRSLDMASSAGFICVEWAVPKSTGEGRRGPPTAAVCCPQGASASVVVQISQTRTSNNGKRKGRTEGGTTPDKEKCEPTGAQRRRSGRGGVGKCGGVNPMRLVRAVD